MIKLPETEEDLQQLVDDNVPEDVHLDYKASEALSLSEKNEILKDISSFANSDGGIIIYGISEDKLKNCILLDDTGIPAFAGKTPIKEWIEKIVDSGINPKISGLQVNLISSENGKDTLALAISIPKSAAAPHQSSDKKYYKRSNSQSNPMEHYEIEDVRNRSHLIQSLVNIDIQISKGVFVDVVISNPGNWNATDIRFSMSESMQNYWQKNGRLPSMFMKGLKILPPQKSYTFIYGVYSDLMKDGMDLKHAEIEVTYFHPQVEEKKTEHFEFDLDDYVGCVIEKSDVTELSNILQQEIKTLNKTIDSISQSVELIAENTGQLAKIKSVSLSYFHRENIPTLYEYDSRVTDVINSSYHTFEQNVVRFIYFINNDKNISERLTALPSIDFDNWYESAKQTGDSMVGSGRLNFSDNELERLSQLRNLFEAVANEKISCYDISLTFMYKSMKFNDCIAEIVMQLFIPFARDMRTFLKLNF
ncbi:MAG: ATP-binding protein [Thiotrichaceae bacterium]|nr:ATP-binding protein [Thiotrichaceae bacterium]